MVRHLGLHDFASVQNNLNCGVPLPNKSDAAGWHWCAVSFSSFLEECIYLVIHLFIFNGDFLRMDSSFRLF